MTLQHAGGLVDVGNAIIDHTNTTRELVDHGDYNTIPEVIGAFDGLKRFSEQFGGNVSCIYKATDTADEKIRQWLVHHRFTERTGIPLERVFRTTDGRNKTGHINQTSLTHYGTTVVVDDRIEVLSHFVGKVPHLFLFRFQRREVEELIRLGQYEEVVMTGVWDHVHRVDSWSQIREILNT